MTITYFYRNHKAGYSIKKVSDLYVNQMEDKEIYEMPSPYASMMSILKNIWFTFKHRNKTGINHITGDIHYCIIPLMFCKTVLTVHDTVVYDNYKGLKKIILKYLWFKIPFLLATKIVCISENTKDSITRFTKRKDIMVIPNAVEPNYQFVPYTFNDKLPNILIIGTNWNKNIERTIDAISNIKCRLTIIGKLTKEQKEKLKNTKCSYSNKIDLSDEEIKMEYIHSDIVSFCSLYEGFGMPIIEGNAIGRPVITSNIAPMPALATGSALLVDPYNVKDIHDKITLYINNKELRQKNIGKGIENAKRYNCAIIANAYKYLYNSLLS